MVAAALERGPLEVAGSAAAASVAVEMAVGGSATERPAVPKVAVMAAVGYSWV